MDNGDFLLDSRGEKVIENYKRFIPSLHFETYYAIGFILLGFAIVVGLEIYGQNQRKHV